jgi:hypothetical protein
MPSSLTILHGIPEIETSIQSQGVGWVEAVRLKPNNPTQ